ncbi:MAG: putative toxin-antitoxin system toxin component, PIN family [Candidatus Obscuribacterales bacterium]|nr:putative toxin-antitoxin system toxin component, PIN family [Candidatus Obscuribacterales bacterium]
MLRVVIDTNVWISGLIKSGPPAKIVSLFAAGVFRVCCSKETMDELAVVLKRPKLADRIDLLDAELLIDLLNSSALLVNTETVQSIVRDPKDQIYLACSDAANADVLVTGDKDLLVLNSYGRTRIMAPAEFCSLFAE